MNDKQPWFVEERATALASLLLTSRKDVLVHVPHSAESAGRIDLLAEVLKDKAAVGRFFCVEVIGRVDLPSIQEIRRTVRLGRKKHQCEYTSPFCVFLFDVRTNHGFYRWLAEPVVVGDEPTLNEQPDGQWLPLNEKVASELVDLVSAWYDALALQLKS